jgi:hypothetical protein
MCVCMYECMFVCGINIVHFYITYVDVYTKIKVMTDGYPCFSISFCPQIALLCDHAPVLKDFFIATAGWWKKWAKSLCLNHDFFPPFWRGLNKINGMGCAGL